METIAGKIQNVRAAIESAARGTGRDPQAVKLVAVSKTIAPETMLEAYRAGQRAFGENQVRDYLAKKDLLPPDTEWHFIGHLQTNKVKALLEARAAGQLALLHSLDRLELAREIEKQSARLGGRSLDCLLQVNASGESSKGGFKPEDAEAAIRTLAQGSPLKIRGLMTIGPLTRDPAQMRCAFRQLRELKERLAGIFPRLDWGVLSMGMSGDYAAAIAEGSTLVRVGTAIFGARN